MTPTTNHSATEFTVRIGGRERRVTLSPEDKDWNCTIDGEPRSVDVIEASPGRYTILMDGQSFEVHVEPIAPMTGGAYLVHTRGHDLTAEVEDPRRWAGAGGRGGAADGPAKITAPMPGKVVRVLVEENQEVTEGEGVIVIEAMKMQNEIRAPKTGVVGSVHVQAGDTVELGAALVTVV